MDDEFKGGDWRTDAADALAERDPERAARGRPKGAKNRKTEEFAAWYQAQGYKDPIALQAEFMSADPVALQAWFIKHELTQKAIGKQLGLAVPALIDIVKEQMACAREIDPYLHGKMPTRVEVEVENLPSLVLNLGTNQLDQAKEILAVRIGSPITTTYSEINDMDEATK